MHKEREIILIFGQKIVKEICDELDIKFTLVSKNWIMVLEKNEKIKYSKESGLLCGIKRMFCPFFLDGVVS